MKSLILAFILGLSVSGVAFASSGQASSLEGQRASLEDCGAYAESTIRETTKESDDKSKVKVVKKATTGTKK